MGLRDKEIEELLQSVDEMEQEMAVLRSMVNCEKSGNKEREDDGLTNERE